MKKRFRHSKKKPTPAHKIDMVSSHKRFVTGLKKSWRSSEENASLTTFLSWKRLLRRQNGPPVAAVQSQLQSCRTVLTSLMSIRSSITFSSNGFSIPAGKTHRTSISILHGTSATIFCNGCSSSTASARRPWWRTKTVLGSERPFAKSQRYTACRLKKSARCLHALYVKKISSAFPLYRPTSNGFARSRRY